MDISKRFKVAMPAEDTGKVVMPEEGTGKVPMPAENSSGLMHRNKNYCPECGRRYSSEKDAFCPQCGHSRVVEKTW